MTDTYVIDTPLAAYQDLLDLIRWLAIPYGTNEPVFAVEGIDGRPLPEGVRRRDTWRMIFGERRERPGVWRQCGECRGWQVVTPDSDRALNGEDVRLIVGHWTHKPDERCPLCR